jgi:hypothetical protein
VQAKGKYRGKSKSKARPSTTGKKIEPCFYEGWQALITSNYTTMLSPD